MSGRAAPKLIVLPQSAHAPFGAHYTPFDDALTDGILEAFQDLSKDRLFDVLMKFGFSAPACGSLADALLRHFDDQPPTNNQAQKPYLHNAPISLRT